MMNPLDSYGLRARLFPAVIAVAPALALIFTLVSWKGFQPSQVVASLGIAALVYAFSDLSRRKGKRVEPGIFAEMGGKPSTQMLRFKNATFSTAVKKRYHAFLGKRVGQSAPTEKSEADDPIAADAFYEACCDWLREHTRDTKIFNLLLNENVSYGFRRNLLGLKPFALVLNLCVLLIALGIIFYGLHRDASYDYTKFVLVFAVSVVHLLWFLVFVTRSAVIEAADTYARQLILSTEMFINASTSAAASRRR